MMKTFNNTMIAVLSLLAATQAHAGDGGSELYSSITLDRLEIRNSNTGNSSYWEGQAWIGSDLNKAWLKTQGSASQGKTQDAEAQLLYSRAVSPFWDAQAGVRHDFGLNGLPARDWLALSWGGTAPYKFEVDATAFLGHGGAVRLKSGYPILLTQRLALLPEIEANFYGRSDPTRSTGSGLSNVDLTLRLRYEISREIAPYVGVMWSSKYGDTANYAQQGGERISDTFISAGLRLWW